MNARVLLLQAREPDDPILLDERAAFASKAGLELDCFVPHDLLGGPPSLDQIKEYDALMVGGSGVYYVSNRDLREWNRLMDVLQEVVAVGHPTFASCFGFQLLVEALGGEIIHDKEGLEVGTYRLELTDSGRRDELMGQLPPTFMAQVGRKDRAERLPPGVLHLASSQLCPYHAFRVPGKPVWATQFHSEMNAEENRARFLQYLDGYAPAVQTDMDEIMERFRPSPETEGLIKAFLDLIR